jgi:hypothetical protein
MRNWLFSCNGMTCAVLRLREKARREVICLNQMDYGAIMMVKMRSPSPRILMSKIQDLTKTMTVTGKTFIAALCLVLLPVARVAAHPYASGVTNKAGTISWVLNESASDVKIIFDNGTTTNDLGSAPVVGTNKFSLSTHTNFAIVVYKAGSGALSQISSDNDIYDNFYGPRGVTVNKNPKT